MLGLKVTRNVLQLLLRTCLEVWLVMFLLELLALLELSLQRPLQGLEVQENYLFVDL